MSWIYLIIGIVLEVFGTTSMKLAEGFTRVVPSVAVFVFYAGAFTCLILALKKLELSVVYAIWSGAGTAIVAVIGIWWFGESLTVLKVVSLLMIVGGVIGLRMGSGA